MDNRTKILDIAMNLNRIGNWAADDYSGKKQRIDAFLKNTSFNIQNLNVSSLPPAFLKTFNVFLKKYRLLVKEATRKPENPIYWAEEMMTWGNILTHRSKLI